MARQKYLLEHSGAFKREIGAMAAKINKRLHELVMARGRVESVRDDSIVYERIRSEATRDVTGAETFAAAAASVARHWRDFPWGVGRGLRRRRPLHSRKEKKRCYS